MNTATKLFAILLLLLAIILGVFAVMVARQPAPAPAPVASAPAQPAQASPPATPSVAVVVAAQPLTAGRRIQSEDVRTVEWGAMPGGGFARVEDVVGKVMRFDVAQNAAITGTDLASGLALRLAPGERAVAIGVDPVLGVANQVQPGDWVDVFFTLPRLGTDVQRHQARLLLSRVRVLAYGTRSVDGAAPQDQAERGAATAVLAVPLAEVNDLLLARGNGLLQLALRSPLDEATPTVALFPPTLPVLAGRAGLGTAEREALNDPANRAYAGVDLPALAGPLPVPPEPPPARPRAPRAGASTGTIEIIRGSSTQQEAF